MVVDDDEAVLDSLAVLLQAEGFAVESFTSARDLLERHPGTVESCVVTDVRMADIDGLELIEALRQRGALPPVIVITGHGDVPVAVKAMKLGARDFIEKPFDPALLITSIRACLAAAARPGAGVDAALAQRVGSLTPREREVLDRLVLGQSNKAIGRDLGISPPTVEIHRARVMEKMAAASLSQLVRMALAAGFDPDLPPTEPQIAQ
jgi:two-component system response regulator FixJ